LVQTFDAGIALLGTEIKSIRDRKANIAEGYARFRDGELWLYNVHIAQYAPARENHDPRRPRKLLLHRRELDRLEQELGQNPRSTVIPLRLYLYRGLAKIEIALARGRRRYDKRQAIAKRDADRAIQRAMRREQR
jgi:SsrA-binding protein